LKKARIAMAQFVLCLLCNLLQI